MTIDHEVRLRELESEAAAGRSRLAGAGALVAIGVVATLAFGISAVRRRVPMWWPVAPAAIAAAAVPSLQRERRAASRAWRLRRWHERALQRSAGLWAGEGFTGEEFAPEGHPYARDLNVVGTGSLFELLSIARTAIGRRGLAGYLLRAAAPEETIERQTAVRELAARPGLTEAVVLLGEFEAAESRWETFTDWLDAPPVPFSRAMQAIAAATSMAVLAILVAGVVGLMPWMRTARALFPLVAFHAVVGSVYRARVRRLVESLRPAAVETSVLREGLALLERQQFESAKLAGIAKRVHGASRAVRQLELLLNALHERNKEWIYPLSLLLLGATQLSMAIEAWRMRHGEALRGWMEAWGEFEALNALGNYTRENPRNTFPAFASAAAEFSAVAVGHPLLPVDGCVTNDVRLDSETRFYIVSGSNMSGKSSLLRTIGLNAVLAQTGAPVRAERLRMSPLAVCASITAVDSLLNGKSKFLVEVERVHLAIQTAAGDRAVLYLIDEIFSGTNSRDRRVAAEAVVRTLVERGAIGALSTHDMSLTEIAEAAGLHGANVHLGARDGSDPMSFDYRLKPGITTETNALAIARMAGVPV